MQHVVLSISPIMSKLLVVLWQHRAVGHRLPTLDGVIKPITDCPLDKFTPTKQHSRVMVL